MRLTLTLLPFGGAPASKKPPLRASQPPHLFRLPSPGMHPLPSSALRPPPSRRPPSAVPSRASFMVRALPLPPPAGIRPPRREELILHDVLRSSRSQACRDISGFKRDTAEASRIAFVGRRTSQWRAQARCGARVRRSPPCEDDAQALRGAAHQNSHGSFVLAPQNVSYPPHRGNRTVHAPPRREELTLHDALRSQAHRDTLRHVG